MFNKSCIGFIIALFCVMQRMTLAETFTVTNQTIVADDDGISSFSFLSVREIVGPTNLIELIGCKTNGVTESIGYCNSSTPLWRENLKLCNRLSIRSVPAEYMRASADGGAWLDLVNDNHGGMEFRVHSNDPCPGGIGIKKAREDVLGGLTGLSLVDSASSRIDNAGDCRVCVFRTTLYVGSRGVTQVWYDIVDSDRTVLLKGYLSGRVAEDGAIEYRNDTIAGHVANVKMQCRPLPRGFVLVLVSLLDDNHCADVSYIFKPNGYQDFHWGNDGEEHCLN